MIPITSKNTFQLVVTKDGQQFKTKGPVMFHSGQFHFEAVINFKSLDEFDMVDVSMDVEMLEFIQRQIMI